MHEGNTETDETVYVVVDPDCGDRIRELKRRVALWAVESSANRQAWDNAESAHPNSAMFKTEDIDARFENLIAQLSDIDEHFGPLSTSKPFETIQVIGLELTPEMRPDLERMGLSDIQRTVDGFRARVTRLR